ncbi:signal recognition particle receptor subunit alpha [Patescibacteria group bacterium]|nr:signal recognition particle receptor subunit alpha [Patescibacteria group bacterium]
MFEKIGESLRKATDKIANAIFLDKNLLDSIIKDLQRALIEADVNIFLVKQISDKIRKGALDERIKEIDKKEHVIKLLHEELMSLLGEHKQLKLKKESGKQDRILLLGLYGTGKTTTIGKIGNYFSKRGKKVLLVGLDTHRPAAPEQLKQIAEKNKIPFLIDAKEKDPLKIWKKNSKRIKEHELVVIDTAGRHTLDKPLIKEIQELTKEINPTEVILIIPADIGQAAKKQAQEFQDAVKISGVIITRMDSTAKGGGALTACAETKAPVYFITTGEKINDLEEFNPKSFLSRLLGMGDLETLMEKIRTISDEKSQKKVQESLKEGRLSLEDVAEQAKSMSSLGGLDKIKSLIPGFSKISKKIPEDLLENQEARISKWPHIIKSMNREEIENPEILEKQTSRISRIAKGAGVHNSDIRALLKQYKLLNEMIKSGGGGGSDMGDMSQGLSQKQIQKFAKKFGKKLRF